MNALGHVLCERTWAHVMRAHVGKCYMNALAHMLRGVLISP